MAVRYAQAPTASSGPTPYSAVSAHTAPRNHLAKNTPAGGEGNRPRAPAGTDHNVMRYSAKPPSPSPAGSMVTPGTSLA